MKTEGTAPVENERQDSRGRKERRQTAAYVADVRQDFPMLSINVFHLSLEFGRDKGNVVV